MNIIAGMMMPLTNCAPEARLEQLVVLVREGLLDLGVPTEHLDEVMSGERLFDLPVQGAGMRPLRDEKLLRPLSDLSGDQDRQRNRDQRDQ